MTRLSLDTSRLPQDVLTYSDKRFFELIQRFCGKDEAELLSIQSIRSVDSFLSIEDIYSIFAIDSSDLDAIQKRCGFRNRNGICTVRPGIKSSLDNIHNLLKQKEKETIRMKKLSRTLTQLTNSPSSSNTDTLSIDTNVTPTLSTKTENEHRENINKSIEEWCINNKEELEIPDFDFTTDIKYELNFSASLDKAEIKCSCGVSSCLLPSDSGNFKMSNYFRHLKNTCLNLLLKSTNTSNNSNETEDNNAVPQAAPNSSLKTPSTKSTKKRTRQGAAVRTNTKKSRTN